MDELNLKKSRSTSTVVINQLFWNLELLKRSAGDPISESSLPNFAMMSVFMAVACVEAFLNIFFRELVELSKFSHIKTEVLKQMGDHRFGLELKLKKWPQMFFNKDLLRSEAGINFNEYRKVRNEILHYNHTYEELEIYNQKFIVTDTTIIFDLHPKYLLNARQVVKDFILEILKASGLSNNELEYHLHRWTGEIKFK